ncbi:septum site-determining protein MinC [Bordetella sp. 2513F-2]
MNTATSALDFKSATLYAIRVVLHSADPAQLEAALAQRMHDAGSFFENEPVVIDASRIDEAIDWPPLLDALRRHNLPPIGVVAAGANLEAAQAAGLAAVELSTPPARPQPAVEQVADSSAPMPDTPAAATQISSAPAPTPESAPEPAAAPQQQAAATTPAPSALIVNRPLRSGQRVYARHTDVVVIGMVSQGAEVIADGNVHVYGPLRGKAMAGARGDTTARIFTTQLDAELLAVAGVYRVVEDKLDASLHNRPALVRLEGDTLHIEALKG